MRNTMTNEPKNYEEFCNLVKDNILPLMSKEKQWIVRIVDADKNNGVRLKGINIMEERSNISPTIYLEGFYEEYKNQTIGLKDILAEVKKVYDTHKKEDVFFDYEKMLKEDTIIACLMNREMNEKLLENIPYIPVGEELVVIFKYYLKEVFGEDNGYITITNHLVEIMKLDTDKLLGKALENMKTMQPWFLASMEHVLLGYPKDLPSTMNMYVLSNQERHFGASAILYPEVRQELYDRFESDIIVLPSSIHEWIVMPVTEVEDFSGLNETVREVNAAEVAKEERLGNSAYVLRRDKLLTEGFENLLYPIKEIFLKAGAM